MNTVAKQITAISILLVFTGFIFWTKPKNAEVGKCYQFPTNASWERPKIVTKIIAIEGNYARGCLYLPEVDKLGWTVSDSSDFVQSSLFNHPIECPKVSQTPLREKDGICYENP